MQRNKSTVTDYDLSVIYYVHAVHDGAVGSM